MANVLSELFQDIADSIRSKTGSTDKIAPADFPASIEAIEGGASADSRVKYVTFMYGETELLQYPVIEGDTCHDPVTDKLIDTPTKEQTVSTVYTYSGWSLTDGGDADSTALQNVTEDRTVYVAFEESARTYTINFYDGETLHDTQTLAYGSLPVVAMPEKDGYSFIEWQPAIAEVTGDADYYAQWKEQTTFAGGSWEDIVAISESGEAPNVFKVGDTREVVMGDYTVTLAIAGFNHDDLADGTGKAGMTIVTKTIYPLKTRWSDISYAYGTIYHTYSFIHKGLNASNPDFPIYNKIPTEIRDSAKSVTKQVDTGKDSSNEVGTVDTKFFALSVAELGYGSMSSSYSDRIATLGERYELFPANGDIRLKLAGSDEYASYWLRQLCTDGNPQMCYQYPNSYTDTGKKGVSWKKWQNSGTYEFEYVMFGFCI